MSSLGVIILLLIYLGCNAAQAEPSLHVARVDEDFASPERGQAWFPQTWQRELMALTALSRLEAANVLSLDTRKETRAWRRFRSNGLYEALLNMVRITDFQMWDKPSPNAWSMWGLEKSFYDYLNLDIYSAYRKAAESYPFGKSPERIPSQLRQASVALAMAAKWDVNLKGSVAFYGSPFYSISETVDAYIKLRDPTSYFKGDQPEGERLLRYKLTELYPPTCLRELRIAIAFDSFGYNNNDMIQISEFLDDVERFTARATITIRGTSGLSGGFPEGALMDRPPRMRTPAGQQDILKLVEDSIADIRASEKGNRLRGRVLIILSKFKSRKTDVKKAESLWKKMRAFDIEPFYFTVETKDITYNDEDLMPLLGGETFRGVSSGLAESEVLKVILHRFLRLMCQSVVSIEEEKWRTFRIHRSYEPQPNSIFNRVHLQFINPKRNDGKRHTAHFLCSSYPSCQFDVYAHASRLVNEYFHDTSLHASVPFGQSAQLDVFPEFGSLSRVNTVVVPKSAGEIGVMLVRW